MTNRYGDQNFNSDDISGVANINAAETGPNTVGTDGQTILRGDGSNITGVSTGLTVGTTSVASGTVNRIFFEGAGNVLQQDANFDYTSGSNALRVGVSSTITNTNAVFTGKVYAQESSSGAVAGSTSIEFDNTGDDTGFTRVTKTDGPSGSFSDYQIRVSDSSFSNTKTIVHVDGDNDRVGINLTDPSTTFQVNGTTTLGNASETDGSIILENSTNANTVTVQTGVTSTSHTYTLPTAQGAADTVLTNDGSGNLSWGVGSGGARAKGTGEETGISASGNFTINHNLGVVPDMLRLTIMSSGSANAGSDSRILALYDGSSESSVVWTDSVSGGTERADMGRLEQNGTDNLVFSVGSFGSSSIQIDWTAAGTPSGMAFVYQWEVVSGGGGGGGAASIEVGDNTRAVNAGAGTQVISHSLGVVPTAIDINAIITPTSVSSTFSTGSSDFTNEYAMESKDGSVAGGLTNTDIIQCKYTQNGGGTVTASVTSVSSSDFTLTWAVTGLPGGSSEDIDFGYKLTA